MEEEFRLDSISEVSVCFKFKEFSVRQKNSPAKITTDATIFASDMQFPPHFKSVLEIGTGTGVLSLILAQRFPLISIEALEINPDAYKEAVHNFKNSKWNSRLNVHLADFKEYRADNKFDIIFSNPPFFQGNLQSKINHGKNTAYHTDQLSFDALVKGINTNLKKEGEAHIMLPPYEMSVFEKKMRSAGFSTKRTVKLRHQAASKEIRLFNVFDRSKQKEIVEEGEVIVRDENSDFHPSYRKLMKDFLIIF